MNLIIQWFFSNFGLAMLFLAIIFIIIHCLINPKKMNLFEIVYRWIALFSLGFTGIYTFIIHAFFPDISANNIGWQTSPFQFEVAMADLTIGVLAILSFKSSFGFRLATVIAAVCFLWGDAVGHIYQMLVSHDFANGNAGSWFWMDVLVPLILLICIFNLKRNFYDCK